MTSGMAEAESQSQMASTLQQPSFLSCNQSQNPNLSLISPPSSATYRCHVSACTATWSPTTSPKVRPLSPLATCEPRIDTQTPPSTLCGPFGDASSPAPAPVQLPLPPPSSRASPSVSVSSSASTASDSGSERRAYFLEQLYSRNMPYEFGVTPPLLWEPSSLAEFELSELLEHNLREHDCYESDEGMNTRCAPLPLCRLRVGDSRFVYSFVSIST